MNEFDVIVVGAGSAGICCAGELVLQGLRPLLAAESKEVGYHFRTLPMEKARPIAQLPTRSLDGEGGWWFSLSRRLNVPVKFHRAQAGFGVTAAGSGTVIDIPACNSAAALTEVFAGMAPAPLGPSREQLERVLHAALPMSTAELASLHDGILGARSIANVRAEGMTQ